MAKLLSRRAFLHQASLASVGFAALLAGCQPKVVEKVVEKEVTKVVKETVVVTEEKVVEKEVEKVVKETVVVEKEAQPVAEEFDLVHWTIYHLLSEEAQFLPYQDLAREMFKDKYPNVNVKWENHGWANDLRQNLMAALLAGTGPDVICGENDFQEYGDMQALIPLDETIADIKNNLVFATYKASVTGGKTYGINQMTGLFGFVRNTKIQEKAGLDPEGTPATWDDLLADCAKAVQAGNDEFYGYSLMGTKGWLIAGILQCAVFLSQLGADMCKDDCTYPWFDNPKSEEYWTFYRELQKYTPPGMSFNPDQGVVYNAVWEDKVAFACDGSWSTPRVKQPEFEHIKFEAFPIPKGGQQSSIIVASVINGVLSASRHKIEAAEYCKMFTEDPLQEMIFTIDRLPSTRTALQKVRGDASEADKTFIDVLLNAEPNVIPQWRVESQKLWEIYNNMFEQVLATDRPIKDLIGEAQQQADAVLASV